jgi:hypothetical protein
MKRLLHLAIAFVAVIMHLGAPVAAYAAMRADVLSADFCTVAGTAAPAADRSSPVPFSPVPFSPVPLSHEHHCAHAPCCAGGAVDAAAPPPVARAFIDIALHRESAPAGNASAAPVPPIAAAQPRGPPLPA